MKNIFKIFAFIALTGLFFTSCQKEESLLSEKQIDQDVVTSGYSNKKAIIDGQTYVFEKQITPNHLKGFVADENWLETGTAFTMGNSEQYQTIKVDRQNGGHFYVMIENLRYNPNNNGSWVYSNNNSNVTTYGRLYDWQTANNLGNYVYMNLPKTKNGRTRILKRFGKLPNVQDIKDILETTQNIGNLPSNGTDFNGGENAWDYYYDAFVAGIALTNNYADGCHTVSGWRNNMDIQPNSVEFRHINEVGKFWLIKSAGSNYHYPLEINYNSNYTYVAFINAGHADRFGFAVRYVFYPFN